VKQAAPWALLIPDAEVISVAIALAESGGNIYAHNATPPDDSYGLWQINMLGTLGPARRAKFGLSKNEDLYAPFTCATAAFTIFVESGKSWNAWSTYKNGAYKRFMDQARAAVANPEQPPDVTGGPDQTETHVLGVIFDPLFAFIRSGSLRAAEFIGGAALLGTAAVLVAKRGIK
jgi:hypothetical protein